MKAFAVQPIREIEGCIAQVEEAFVVSDQFFTAIFKNLIAGFFFVVEVHFIAQSGATAPNNRHANEVIAANSCLRFEGF